MTVEPAWSYFCFANAMLSRCDMSKCPTPNARCKKKKTIIPQPPSTPRAPRLGLRRRVAAVSQTFISSRHFRAEQLRRWSIRRRPRHAAICDQRQAQRRVSTWRTSRCHNWLFSRLVVRRGKVAMTCCRLLANCFWLRTFSSTDKRCREVRTICWVPNFRYRVPRKISNIPICVNWTRWLVFSMNAQSLSKCYWIWNFSLLVLVAFSTSRVHCRYLAFRNAAPTAANFPLPITCLCRFSQLPVPRPSQRFLLAGRRESPADRHLDPNRKLPVRLRKHRCPDDEVASRRFALLLPRYLPLHARWKRSSVPAWLCGELNCNLRKLSLRCCESAYVCHNQIVVCPNGVTTTCNFSSALMCLKSISLDATRLSFFFQQPCLLDV